MSDEFEHEVEEEAERLAKELSIILENTLAKAKSNNTEGKNAIQGLKGRKN